MTNEGKIVPVSLSSSHKRWIWALILIVVATAIVRFMLPIRDGDIWFHLSYADYFLNNKTLIPDHSVYSWTPTVNTEHYCAWFAEIILYFIYQVGGITGLIVFRYVCVAFFIFAIVRYAKLLSVFWHPLTWLIALLAILTSYVAIYAKPEIFSWVYFTMMVWNWWYIRKKKKRVLKNCYLFPILILVWVNSHGAFLLGIVFLLLICTSEILNTWLFPHQTLPQSTRKHLFIGIFLSLLAILITPYGLSYPKQLFYEIIFPMGKVDGYSTIAAYISPLSVEARTKLFAYYINSSVCIFIYLLYKNWRKGAIEASSIITTFCFVYLYTQYWRTTFFFAPVFLFSSLYLLQNSEEKQLNAHFCRKHTQLIVTIILTIFLSVTTLYEGYVKPEKYLWTGFGLNEGTPVEAFEYIISCYPNSIVGNTYGAGTYFLWKRGPTKKVFIDARYFPYEKWIGKYWDFRAGVDVNTFLAQYPCDVWVVGLSSNPKLLNWFLKSPEWKLDFYGKTSAVFVRKAIALDKNTIVGKSIDNIHNPHVALMAFTFACNIWDLDCANRVLALVKNRFNRFNHRFTTELSSFHNGMVAYHHGEYLTAVEYFEEVEGKYIFNESLLMASYSLAINKLWENNELKKAAEFAHKAYLENPNSLINLYNLGVINGYLNTVGQLKHKPGNPWKKLLTLFIEHVIKKDPKNQYVLIAKRMLANQYLKKPKLILMFMKSDPII